MEMVIFPKIKLAMDYLLSHSVNLRLDFHGLLIIRTEFDEIFSPELSNKLINIL